MASNKKYWKSIEELNPNSALIETLKNNEFAEEVPVDEFLGNKDNLEKSVTSRRDFLKYVGFTTAAASLSACEGPVKKTIPYVIQPEQIRPGVADYYATTILDGFDYVHALVRTREGRPISIEKNKTAKFRNVLGARSIASVLGLYDSFRLQGPTLKGEIIPWEHVDEDVVNNIQEAKSSGKRVVLLTNTLASPSTSQLISEFSNNFGGVDHVVYDSISNEAILSAFEEKYGVRAMPDYDLSKAEVIVSFGADFLGDWQAGGFADRYAQGRIPKEGKMSYHIQLESNMTCSGANADRRVAITPSQMKLAFARFYANVLGLEEPQGNLPADLQKIIDKTAEIFKKSGDKAVIMTDIPEKEAQTLALDLNDKIASQAMDYRNPILISKGRQKEVLRLVEDMLAGKVGVLITSGVNPVYTMPKQMNFDKAFSNVPFSVVFSQHIDETSSKATYVVGSSHNLESWGDVELKSGYFGLMQPTIKPLFDTRQLQEALLTWSGSGTSYYDYLKAFWNKNILEGFAWDKALHDGIFEGTSSLSLENNSVDTKASLRTITQSQQSPQEFELVLYPKTGMGDGTQANNPWLQEFPDPITRVSWDNYVTISRFDANRLGIKQKYTSKGALDGSYANLTVKNVTLKVPVIIQPGQAKNTLGLSYGYGKWIGLKEEMQVGVNAFTVYNSFKNVQTASIQSQSDMHEFACVQLQNTLAGRDDIIIETSLDTYKNQPKEVWNKAPEVSYNHQDIPATSTNLWDEFDTSLGHHFNMSIDLNACVGCGTCVIACHSENNVPVVGKKEVRVFRDMHWLRIDRYYSSEEDFEGDFEKYEKATGTIETAKMFKTLKDPSGNPQVAFQPLMCQHCNHAPCETVCPVAATSHGRQGQNQMAYNRCVGTRYCANNCPYKVRRFNWFLYHNNEEFDYHMNNDLGKMVLNPDVVVRSRGVMEKCSFCIQKTQKTILDAKLEKRAIKDGEFETACSNACSTGAIVFGDVNDEKSAVAHLKESDRAYHLLEHKGTKPNVFYHVKVRNTKEI